MVSSFFIDYSGRSHQSDFDDFTDAALGAGLAFSAGLALGAGL